jgi:hypothetical protein
MARGKFRTKKSGTTPGPRGVNGPRVGSQPGAASGQQAAPKHLGQLPRAAKAGSQAGLPALGIAVMSPWGWRVLALFTMVALGLCLTFFIDGKSVFGGLWVVVSVAWGGFSLRLWRQHLKWDSTSRLAR